MTKIMSELIIFVSGIVVGLALGLILVMVIRLHELGGIFGGA